VNLFPQVYYVPNNADAFFDNVYNQMMLKLPTLSTSHVHSVNRKLLFTAYHFAVFGIYPSKLIELALNEKQVWSEMSQRLGEKRHKQMRPFVSFLSLSSILSANM